MQVARLPAAAVAHRARPTPTRIQPQCASHAIVATILQLGQLPAPSAQLARQIRIKTPPPSAMHACLGAFRQQEVQNVRRAWLVKLTMTLIPLLHAKIASPEHIQEQAQRHASSVRRARVTTTRIRPQHVKSVKKASTRQVGQSA